jgi:hypothetical protein
MAKTKASGTNHKVNFGKRRKGAAQKRKGPKDKQVSKYRGQGR